MKNRRLLVTAVIFFGLLLVLYGTAGILSAKPPSAPSSPSAPSAPSPAASTHSSAPPPAATPTWSSLAQTNMAEAPARWTSVAATNAARGAVCMPGFELEMRESIASMSTDEWTIFTCSPRPKKAAPGTTPEPVDYRDRYTQVVSIDQSRIWTIMHRQFEWSNRSGAFLVPYRWTRDGNFVYLVWDYIPGPDGFYAPGFFFDDIALFRLNLNNGFFESIFPYSQDGYAFGLSPDDQLIAYRNPGEPLRIRIRDLGNGAEKIRALFGGYVLTGAFVWNPGGTAVYFASAMAGWEEGTAGVSLFELTADRMSMRTVLFNDPRLIIPHSCYADREFYSWAGDGLLCVTSLDEESDLFLNNSLLDVRTGKIVPAVTPTPGPSRGAAP